MVVPITFFPPNAVLVGGADEGRDATVTGGPIPA